MYNRVFRDLCNSNICISHGKPAQSDLNWLLHGWTRPYMTKKTGASRLTFSVHMTKNPDAGVHSSYYWNTKVWGRSTKKNNKLNLFKNLFSTHLLRLRWTFTFDCLSPNRLVQGSGGFPQTHRTFGHLQPAPLIRQLQCVQKFQTSKTAEIGNFWSF